MLTFPVATWLVRALGAYLVVGVGFAIPFAARWVNRLDDVAAHGTPGFRGLLLPSAALLWPLLLVRLLRRRPA